MKALIYACFSHDVRPFFYPGVGDSLLSRVRDKNLIPGAVIMLLRIP